MNFIADCGKKIILIVLIAFIVFTFIFSFSFLFFAILIFLCLFYKRVEREITDDDDNIIISPVDAKIINIIVDENKKNIVLVLEKAYRNVLFDSQEIRSIIKTDSIKTLSIDGLKYSEDFYSNAKQIIFSKEVSMIIKPAKFPILNLCTNSKALKGQRIGFLSSGIIEITLPYSSTILVALKDKVLANSSIARLGE